MAYFIIHKRDRFGRVLGMSRMPWPATRMVACKLKITPEKHKGTFTVYRNENKGLPIKWIPIYFGREITEAEYESYTELELFRELKADFVGRFVKKYGG